MKEEQLSACGPTTVCLLTGTAVNLTPKCGKRLCWVTWRFLIIAQTKDSRWPAISNRPIALQWAHILPLLQHWITLLAPVRKWYLQALSCLLPRCQVTQVVIRKWHWQILMPGKLSYRVVVRVRNTWRSLETLWNSRKKSPESWQNGQLPE